MSALHQDVEADQLIAKSERAPWTSYWLDAALLAAMLACGVAVHRALTLPREAVVTVSNVRKGEPLQPHHLALAPLVVSRRNVTVAQKAEGLIAARDLESAQPLRWQDVVKARPRAAAQELELPLKIFVGPTPPRVGESVLLAFVAKEGAGTAIVAARVLAIDAAADPASLTVAMARADAARVAVIPDSRIQLMQPLAKEPKR